MKQHSISKHFTRGGQITFHNIRMLFQVSNTVGKLYLVFLLAAMASVVYLITSKDALWAAIDYRVAEAFYWTGQKNHLFNVPFNGQNVVENTTSLLAQSYYQTAAADFNHTLLISFFIALAGSLILALILIHWLTQRGKAQNNHQFIRGAQLEPYKKVKKAIEQDGKASNITLDGFPMIKDAEVQHFLAHGTIGTGKSQLIMKFLDQLRKRGDRVIVYDKGCSLTPLYYKESDVILNPFDARCAAWDLWKEAPLASDLENMAESLIPLHGETDPFWVNAARTVFASTAHMMREDPECSLEKLLKVLLTAEFDELESYIQGTEAATLVSGKIEKTAISIRSIITTFLKSLRFLRGLHKGACTPFSIRQWILDDSHQNWLFISSNGETHAALRPLISMWMAMASVTMLSLKENYERRIWFVCDELPSLHKLPLLPETIAEVRKFGGSFFLGMQNFAQLEKVYGRNAAREIFDLLNTRFFFRSPSSDLARLVSHELGEIELEDLRENYSYGANQIRDGISVGHQRVTRPIVSYSEVMGLKDLNCYVRLPGAYPVTQLSLTLEKREIISENFIPRDIPIDPALEKVIERNEARGQAQPIEEDLPQTPQGETFKKPNTKQAKTYKPPTQAKKTMEPIDR